MDEICTCETPKCTLVAGQSHAPISSTWQTIRDDDIRVLYERTKAAGGYSGPYGPFRRYVTQADLGPPYVENAPDDRDLVHDLPDDIKEGIWIDFK